MLNNYKKAKVNGRVTTVVTPREVLESEIYQNKFTSVEVDDVILPVKNSYDPTTPGFYLMCGGKLGKIVKPSEDDKAEYSVDNAIDFSNITSMREVISKQEEVKRMESELLSNSDNLFKPVIKDNDSREMKALKEAVCAKNMDIDVYADRFNDNFNNDKRLLKGSSITMSKLKSISDNLDIKVTLVLSDRTPNVPNPMNKSISVDICGYDYDEE